VLRGPPGRGPRVRPRYTSSRPGATTDDESTAAALKKAGKLFTFVSGLLSDPAVAISGAVSSTERRLDPNLFACRAALR
jgi:hypothetical protein